MTDEEPAAIRAQAEITRQKQIRELLAAGDIVGAQRVILDALRGKRDAMREIVRAVAGYEPEHREYSGYYRCQFCQRERREEPPYGASLADWVTHAPDCVVTAARALLAAEATQGGEGSVDE